MNVPLSLRQTTEDQWVLLNGAQEIVGTIVMSREADSLSASYYFAASHGAYEATARRAIEQALAQSPFRSINAPKERGVSPLERPLFQRMDSWLWGEWRSFRLPRQ